MTLARVLLSVVLLVSFTEGQKSQPQPNAAKVESKTALTIEWITPPRLDGTSISGSLLIYNSTDSEFDQTVVVLAVNEIGKAFALGYQHFSLPHKSISVPIQFEATLPPGRYVIHADAVAEVPRKKAIYRARLQTPTALVVSGI